jgi:dTDP-4-amino-4,6-dideoxygalactose transaminase
MIAKAKSAVSLIAGSIGRFTPFLKPDWPDGEWDVLRGWLAGRTFPSAEAGLVGSIQESLGGSWTVKTANMGRTAIYLALKAMELPAGSEVIVPSFACNGVAAPILRAGLSPIFADVDSGFNLDIESVREAASDRTKAVIVPHLSGLWNRSFSAIVEWARSRGIFVVEDAAQAMGLSHAGKPVGTFGDVGIFSCHGGKQIVSTGGAWLITRIPEIARRLERISLPPESPESLRTRIQAFAGEMAGGNAGRGRRRLTASLRAKLFSRTRAGAPAGDIRFPIAALSEIEAQLALLQMPLLRDRIERRRINARRWMDGLGALGLESASILPAEDNVRTKMLLAFPGVNGAEESKMLAGALARRGIECESSYVPLHLRTPYTTFRRTRMDMTDALWRGAFSLPVRPNLDDADWIRIEASLTDLREELAARKKMA